MCLGGVWGTVCHDERSWSLHSAEVVCGQLGYGHPGECTVVYVDVEILLHEI